jgi:hypothetical protein
MDVKRNAQGITVDPILLTLLQDVGLSASPLQMNMKSEISPISLNFPASFNQLFIKDMISRQALCSWHTIHIPGGLRKCFLFFRT